MSIMSISKIKRTSHYEAPQKKLSFRIPKRLPTTKKKEENSKNRPFYSLHKSKSDRIITNTECCSPRLEGHRISGRQITQPFGVIHSLIKKNRTKIAARKSDISSLSRKQGPNKKICNVTDTDCSNNSDLYQYQSRSNVIFIESSRTTSSNMCMLQPSTTSNNNIKNKRLQGVEKGRVLQQDSSRTFPISAEESESEELVFDTSIAIDHVLPSSTTRSNDINIHDCKSPSNEVVSCSSSKNRSTLPATRPLHHRDFIQEELDFEEAYLNNSTATVAKECYSHVQKNDTKRSLDHCDLPYCKVGRVLPQEHYPAFLISASALSSCADHNTKLSSISQFTRDSYLLHQSYRHQEGHCSHDDGLTMSMSRSVCQVIRSLKGNDRCFECGTRKNLSHAFVPLGIIICDECSYDEMEYANEGDILSFQYDFDWRHHEIMSVLEGGNDAFRIYLRNNCEANDEGWILGDEALYDDVKLSVTALRYRRRLEKRVRSVTSALGKQKQQQNIRFNNTSFEDEEEEDCWSSNISTSSVKKKVGMRGRFSLKKMCSSRF